MVSWLPKRRYSPIGIDVGGRSVKLVQLSGDRSRLIEAARVELAPASAEPTPEETTTRIGDAIAKGLAGRAFHGRDVVVCLNERQLFLQSVRVPKQVGGQLDKLVAQEVASRLPYPIADAELRYVEAADVRQGDSIVREVIVFACQRTVLHHSLEVCQRAKLNPLAVDVEPAALVRSYAGQCRREEDRQSRSLVVHVGYHRTAAMIAQGDDLLFVKYIDVGGQHLDTAVATYLKMDLQEAVALRRHSGDRRAEMQDPEIARSLAQAVRPALERLSGELAMCVRYHSVTFRGQQIARFILGGGEATVQLLEALGKQLELPCELSDPFRSFAIVPNLGRKGQWDVAAGLAMRDLN
jgi:type IV pilus assembly protein PilM